MTKKRNGTLKKGQGHYFQLVSAIAILHSQMVGSVATVANQALVLRNWIVGAYIVEFEQHGSDRAKYGARLLEALSKDLAAKGLRGFGISLLERMRRLYLVYPQMGAKISQSQIAEWGGDALRMADSVNTVYGIRGPIEPKSDLSSNSVIAVYGKAKGDQSHLPEPFNAEHLLRLSWSHFLEFIRIDDPWKRAFYENECLHGHWSVRQLQRQIESLLYERTGLSANKKAVVKRARNQAPLETVEDMFRDPYILEFTGLAERPEYSEDQLETALLDHLQRFLLELGRGFCFEARQFRMTEGRKHHRVDLVFYHRVLRCHVLIDLKIRAFRPEDAGQMNFYVNWFRTNMMIKGDRPPVGILLCSDKDNAEVEFATAGMSQKLFVTRYLTVLPSVEQLKAFLRSDRAEIQ
jgi:predicted nuclease of restriction endonuclease-like (RecB) superfamily